MTDLTKDQVIASWEVALIFENDPFIDIWTTKMSHSNKRMIVIKIGSWARRLIWGKP